MSEMRLHDAVGNRLYLDAEERADFLAVACRQTAGDRTLCETLLHRLPRVGASGNDAPHVGGLSEPV